MDNGKCIAAARFNSTDFDGQRVKNYLWAFDKGIVILNRLRYQDRGPLPTEVVLCRKFNKNLLCEGISFKYSSLMTMAAFAHKHLKNFQP